MISEIFILLFTGIVLLLPLGFWMYIFLSFVMSGVSQYQFLLGIGAWAIATIPLALHKHLFIGDWLYTIFVEMSLFSQIFFSWNMVFALMKFFLMIGSIFFFIWYIIHKQKRSFIRRSINTSFWLLAIVCFVCIWIYAIFLLLGDVYRGSNISYYDIVFSWLASICGYYLLVWIIEEGVKYLWALNFWKEKNFYSRKKYICLCASVALGFAFFENIFYIIEFIRSQWVNMWVLEIAFFRGIFSVVLHILSSMLFAYGFWYIMWGIQHISQTLYFFSLGSLGIFSHALFDIFLSFWLLGAFGIYIFATYVFVSYISTLRDEWLETPAYS